MSKSVNHWMNWHDGIDLVAQTGPNLKSPNIIITLAKNIMTPVGNASAGLIRWQPDPTNIPAIMAVISPDETVGRYLMTEMLAGSQFEQIPVLKASINIQIFNNKSVSRCEVAGYRFEVEMSDFSPPYLINRPPSALLPFWQQGIEMSCAKTILQVNGHVIDMIIPPLGINGGPASVIAPVGIYAR